MKCVGYLDSQSASRTWDPAVSVGRALLVECVGCRYVVAGRRVWVRLGQPGGDNHQGWFELGQTTRNPIVSGGEGAAAIELSVKGGGGEVD